MAVREQIKDPVAKAHMSRSGQPNRRAQALATRDVLTVLEYGWLPSDEYLDGLELQGIGELREDHTRFLRQRDEAVGAIRQLEGNFQQEDADWEESLRQAFADGKDASTLKDKRTLPGDREAQLGRARQEAKAAGQAAIEWAASALRQMRSLIPSWENSLNEANADTQSEIDRLNARIDALKKELIADKSLRQWFKRATGEIPGNAMAFGRIETVTPDEPKVLGPYAQVAKRQADAARGIKLSEEGFINR